MRECFLWLRKSLSVVLASARRLTAPSSTAVQVQSCTTRSLKGADLDCTGRICLCQTSAWETLEQKRLKSGLLRYESLQWLLNFSSLLDALAISHEKNNLICYLGNNKVGPYSVIGAYSSLALPEIKSYLFKTLSWRKSVFLRSNCELCVLSSVQVCQHRSPECGGCRCGSCRWGQRDCGTPAKWRQ